MNTLYSNTIGTANTANGFEALFSNTTGNSNIANGYQALYSNTGGSGNIVNGYQALYTNTTGSTNIANGFWALKYNTSGSENIAIGAEALNYNSIGNFNIAIGDDALFRTFTSNKNTVLGHRAGYNYEMGWNNTLVGAFSDVNAAGIFNSIAIGETATVTGNNQARIGISSVTSIGGFAGWSNVSDGRVKKNIQENVPGLSFISKLKPVSYTLNLDAADRIMQKLPVTDKDGKIIHAAQFEIDARKQKEEIVYTGFIAQDVEKAAKELGFDFSGVDAAKNEKDLYGLRYAEFVVPLVKAVQEQQQMISDLQKRTKLLEEQNKLLLQLLNKK